MSLDFRLERIQPTEVYWANITHNLNKMAEAAGIYHALWHPELIPATTANEIIPILESGLEKPWSGCLPPVRHFQTQQFASQFSSR